VESSEQPKNVDAILYAWISRDSFFPSDFSDESLECFYLIRISRSFRNITIKLSVATRSRINLRNKFANSHYLPRRGIDFWIVNSIWELHELPQAWNRYNATSYRWLKATTAEWSLSCHKLLVNNIPPIADHMQRFERLIRKIKCAPQWPMTSDVLEHSTYH